MQHSGKILDGLGAWEMWHWRTTSCVLSRGLPQGHRRNKATWGRTGKEEGLVQKGPAGHPAQDCVFSSSSLEPSGSALLCLDSLASPSFTVPRPASPPLVAGLPELPFQRSRAQAEAPTSRSTTRGPPSISQRPKYTWGDPQGGLVL